MKNTLIVNLFSNIQSPINKSIISAYILAQLRISGVECEIVSLCTKGLNENDSAFKNTFYILGKQSYMVSSLFGEIDVIINEFPLINGMFYTDNKHLDFVVMDNFSSYGDNNLNIYLNGVEDSEEDKMNTISLFNNICDEMSIDRISFIDVNASMEGCSEIVQLVVSILGYMRQSEYSEE